VNLETIQKWSEELEEDADPDPPQPVPPGIPLGTALPMTEAGAEVKRPAAGVKRSAEAEAAAAGVINVSQDEKRRKRYEESQEGDCQEGRPDCQTGYCQGDCWDCQEMRDAEREMQPPPVETWDERVERELNQDLDDMEF